jgi:hypothetical protein
MGISVASFAASSLVKGTKRDRKVYALRTDLRRELGDAQEILDAAKQQRDELNERLGEAFTQLQEFEGQSEEEGGLAEDERKSKSEVEAQIQLLKVQIPQASKAYETARARWQEIKKQCDQESESVEGLLYANKDPGQAALSDLFRGDEVGNYRRIDLSKVQMFFFTVVILVSHGMALSGLLQHSSLVLNPLGVDLPAFSSSMNALFGISHAGYVSVKAVDHTQTG